MDNSAGHYRLNYRRRRHASVLSAKCRRPISPRRFNRFHTRRDPGSFSLVQVCEEEGADISGQRSQPLTAALVDRATHIFAMTGGHVETIQTMFPQSADKTFLLREFEEPGTTVWRDVPDPIGLGREVYVDCAHIIKNALPSVLAFVEQGALVPPGAASTGGVYAGSDISRDVESEKMTSSSRTYGEALRLTNPEIFDAIMAEAKRQRENIELI